MYSQISNGSHPGKKERNLSHVHKYLSCASISNKGLLVVSKLNPYGTNPELIIVPQPLVQGLLNALHIQLNHPAKHQMKLVFSKYFFMLNQDELIDNCVSSCSVYNSFKEFII